MGTHDSIFVSRHRNESFCLVETERGRLDGRGRRILNPDDPKTQFGAERGGNLLSILKLRRRPTAIRCEDELNSCGTAGDDTLICD